MNALNKLKQGLALLLSAVLLLGSMPLEVAFVLAQDQGVNEVKLADDEAEIDADLQEEDTTVGDGTVENPTGEFVSTGAELVNQLPRMLPELYTVRYTFNWGIEGVSNPTGSQLIAVGASATPSEPTDIPLRRGYTFGGWSPEVGRISRDTTFTAIWNPINRPITIYNEPASVIPENQTISRDETPGAWVLLESGHSPDYEFLGWVEGSAPSSGHIDQVEIKDTRHTFGFEMPTSNVTYTALWGNEDGFIGVPNSRMLTINNEPASVIPTEQTPSGYETPGTAVEIRAGHSPDYTFLGWVSGNIEDVEGAIKDVVYTFEMPTSDVTYTALWGNEDGEIGVRNSRKLTINNEPASVIPIDQTPSGYETPGTLVEIRAGHSPGYTFLGWISGNDVPTSGNIKDIVHVFDDLNYTEDRNHKFEMPTSDVTYTALWGNENGEIGVPNSRMLTINNEPASVIPTEQTPSGYETPGTLVEIRAGHSPDYTFLGWISGNDVPTSGNIKDIVDVFDDLNYTEDRNHKFEMPTSDVTYTALWGNENGEIGVRNSRMLTINNEPASVIPIDQTPSGYETPGTLVEIRAGHSPDYTFLGWISGNDVPTSGNIKDIVDVFDDLNYTEDRNHKFEMPTSDVTYTALWGNENGEIGVPNSRMLTINNEPASVIPTEQTPSGYETPGTLVEIRAGHSPDYTFLGWVIGDVPTSGSIDDIEDIIEDPSHTFIKTDENITYTALWGNENGHINVPNYLEPIIEDTTIKATWSPIPVSESDTKKVTPPPSGRRLPQTGAIVGSSLLGSIALVATGVAVSSKKKKMNK